MDNDQFEYYNTFFMIVNLIHAEALDNSYIKRLDKWALELNDPYLSCALLSCFPYEVDYYSHISIITRSLNPECNYLAAKYFPDTPIAEMTTDGITIPITSTFLFKRSVVLSENPKYNLFFARDIEPINLCFIKYSGREENGNDGLEDYSVVGFNRVMHSLINPSDSRRSKIEDIKMIIYDVDNDLHREVVETFGDEELLKDFDRDVGGKTLR